MKELIFSTGYMLIMKYLKKLDTAICKIFPLSPSPQKTPLFSITIQCQTPYWNAWNEWWQKTHLRGGTRQLEQRQDIRWIQRGLKNIAVALGYTKGRGGFIFYNEPVCTLYGVYCLSPSSRCNPTEEPSFSLIQNSHKDSPTVGNWLCLSTWTMPCCETPLKLTWLVKTNHLNIVREIRPVGWMSGFLGGKWVVCLLAWV